MACCALRVGEPAADRSLQQQQTSKESSRFLLDEDFQALYRQLFGYQAGANADLSMAAGLSLPAAGLSMLSFAPLMSMAPILSMAPGLSMGQLDLSMTYQTSQGLTQSAPLDSVEESLSTYDNNKDSTRGKTNGPSDAQAGFDATMSGAFSAAGVAIVVAAVAYKMKRSGAAASSQQSVASDEASVPTLPSSV